jgi:hypothetical protein
MFNLFVSALFSIIIIASTIVTNAQSLEKLTPVSDPFEFQNEYYPITVGNYWKFIYLSLDDDENMVIKGHIEYRITEYTFEEIYFGDSLEYVPLFKLESKYLGSNAKEYDNTEYSYLIKTYQGIIVCMEPAIDKKIKPYHFIPCDSSYDFLSLSLTGMTIERDVELKTRFWEMNTIRITYKDKQNIAGFFYSKDKGHVYTQYLNKKRLSHFKVTETYEPGSEFILSEFKIE